MRVVGLTGGVASGKSTVSRYLASRGIPIIDADQVVRELQSPGQPVWRAILTTWGWWTVDATGHLDRRRLGRLVFSVPEVREQLNGIVHPPVRLEMRRQLELYRNACTRLVILDVPLLIEGGLFREVDQVWLVYAHPHQQRARLMARDGLSVEEADRRIRSQLSLTEKKSYADVILDNSGDVDGLLQQVESALQAMLRK